MFRQSVGNRIVVRAGLYCLDNRAGLHGGGVREGLHSPRGRAALHGSASIMLAKSSLLTTNKFLAECIEPFQLLQANSVVTHLRIGEDLGRLRLDGGS